MALGLFTVIIMLAVVYSFWQEDLLTACAMLINVMLAGLITFGFFEMLADLLEPMFQGSFLAGWEDFLCLIALFSGSLGLLRLATHNLAVTNLEYYPLVLRAGCVICGLLTGYLVSGFLICACLTMPIPKGASFAGFDPNVDPDSPTQGMRSWMPPDRVWLALMHRAGAKGFTFSEDPTFDRNGNYQLRYYRYKQYDQQGNFEKPSSVLRAK